MITPEQDAALDAELLALFGPPPRPPKPKVVARDGEVIRDVDVVVSAKDPNARYRETEVVAVRRADWVTINIAEAERQWSERLQASARPDKDTDPMGVWRRIDD
jgi:hypothetical protein